MDQMFECDLVMKGGVTSGIVYPSAIAEIAAHYTLRSVGGTSAGAIGAAAAAAMEFGRRSGRNPSAREQLADLSSKLGEEYAGQPLLFRLFTPDPSAAKPFSIVLSLSKAKGKPALFWAIAGMPFLVAFAISASLALLSVQLGGAHNLNLGLAAVAATIILTPLIGTVLTLVRWVLIGRKGANAVAGNNFGFCSGMAKASPSEDSLTEWIHKQLQSLSGKGSHDPLTYGDLWTASHQRSGVEREVAFSSALHAAGIDIPAIGEAPIHLVPRDIELALVASDISRAQTVQLPFMRREDRLFAYLPDLEALFPADVVSWVKDHARATRDDYDNLDDLDLGDLDLTKLVRLPWPQDMPVIIGVRMSLSFPFLFSAVRLYLLRGYGHSNSKELVELWFADGGITSNFPLHLFDAPIPNRPTFCLNLLYHDDELEVEISASGPTAEAGAASLKDGLAPASAPDQDLVFVLRDNNGRLSPYTRFAQGDPIARLMRFGGRVVSTARQWGDNQLLDVPGFRDRIVHVRMKPNEGGFNLNMDKTTIASLKTRGGLAGSIIARRFLPTAVLDPAYPGEPLVLNWANHRFVRFRAFLSGVETMASRFAGAWSRDIERASLAATDPKLVEPSIQDLIHQSSTSQAQKAGYPFATFQRKLADNLVASLRGIHAIAPNPAANGIDYVQGRAKGPKPKQSLKLRPSADSDILNERP